MNEPGDNNTPEGTQSAMPQNPGLSDEKTGIDINAEKSINADNNDMNPGVNLVMDVPVTVTMELGRSSMVIRDILALEPGSVVELNKPVDDALDIYVNGTLIAQGEAVRVGEHYGVRLTHVVNTTDQLNRKNQ